MKLLMGNTATKLEEATPDEQAWLQAYLTFEDTSQSFFMANGKAGYSGSKQRSLMNMKTWAFPAGLTGGVVRAALKIGIQVEVLDLRKKPKMPLGREVSSWRFDYQHEAVDKALNRTKGILHLPTGAGKTECFCSMVLRTPDTRWLFLAPETDLMHNAQRRLIKRTEGALSVGLLGDGVDDTDHRVVCATFQTIGAGLTNPGKSASTKEFLKGFTGIIVDEVHQASADKNYGIVLQTPNAYYRIGLSGTPLSRGDSRNIYTTGGLGDVIHQVKPKFLIDRQYIARPNITMVPHICKIPTRKTYIAAYKECIASCVRRNRLVVGVAEFAKKPCLVFVKNKNHGKDLEKRMRDHGIRAAFIYGDHSTAQRDRAIQDLENGNLEVAICTKIWQTGTDIPSLASLINAAGGASAIEAIQRVGRALRVVRDDSGKVVKAQADIYDIHDIDPKVSNGKTGRKVKTKARDWFQKHAESRVGHYKSQGYPIIILEPEDTIRFGAILPEAE